MTLMMALADVRGVKRSIRGLAGHAKGAQFSSPQSLAYTTVPSLNQSFIQHSSYWAGQPGGAEQVIAKLERDIQWIDNMLDNHISVIEQQDQMTGNMLDKFDFTNAEKGIGLTKCFAPRNTEPFSNLSYLTPVTVAEAGTPLMPLIAQFTSTDTAPLDAARRWQMAAGKVNATAERLMYASGGLAGATEGASFDEARSALEDFAKRSRTIAANAEMMAESVSLLPIVRSQGLAALQAIQAHTAAIPEPAVRLATEQAEVATFVSTHLQPSLDIVKPPVYNFGVPVSGRTGSGAAKLQSFATTGPAAPFNGFSGHIDHADSVEPQELGQQSTEAVNDTPNPTATTQPASAAPQAPNTAPTTQAVNPSGTPAHAPGGPAAPVSPTPSTPTLPAGTSPAAANSMSGAPLAHTMNGRAVAPGGQPIGGPNLGRSGNSRINNQASTAVARNIGRVVRPPMPSAHPDLAARRMNLPGASNTGPGAHGFNAHGANTQSNIGRGASLGTGGHGFGYGNASGNTSSGLGRTGSGIGSVHNNAGHNTTGNTGQPGRNTSGQNGHNVTSHNGQTSQHNNANNGANNHTGRGVTPTTGTNNLAAQKAGVGAGTAGVLNQTNPNNSGRGFFGGMGPGAGAGKKNNRSAGKGAGQWAASVNEYFKRQFLGAKPKTTRGIITQ